ncbi:hypothetical protein BDP27DRAFT_1419223 [Rhodocollybia butyracea]|uniref:Uncharacterized protein n=1 Tax=Rhodocollybia butyracea TaxID=206335 RepID=A0A9P5PWE0_9AGAR|nr:hypothetical protein BDP27DRAFT_1419223 [Rhodocollybia butyracea]
MHSSNFYTTSHGEDSPNAPVFERAAKAMEGNFVECSIDQFLEMLPARADMPSVGFAPFKKLLKEAKSEKRLYKPWIEAMKPYIHKDWVFVDTSHHASQSVWGKHHIKPDVSLYGPNRNPKAPVCDLSEMESNGEFKWSEDDEPFRREAEGSMAKARQKTGRPKKKKMKTDSSASGQALPFEHPSESARNTRGS